VIRLLSEQQAWHVIPDTMVAALGHDLGKLLSQRSSLYALGEHPLAAGKPLAGIALVSTLFNIDRQIDMAYANFKGRLGEMGGISHEEGEALMEEGREIVMAFSDFTGRLCERIRFRCYPPREIEEYLQAIAPLDRISYTALRLVLIYQVSAALDHLQGFVWGRMSPRTA
jgi:hypothetical protein